MRVIRADVLGMCFGVRDALAVLDGIAEPAEVTIHGQLVHNPVVLNGLAARGFGMNGETDRAGALPSTPVVLITAHGISDRERGRLEKAGKVLFDTTCPLVKRVHLAARSLANQGYHVLVIGQKGHVEVQGIVDDLDSVDVVRRESEVAEYPQKRLGIVCQTTASDPLVRVIRATIEARNPHAEIRFVDTVCLPTREHQQALERLIKQAEAVVVVGGHNSNNTRALAERCRELGRPALHVESAAELDPAWFRGFATVGLTAGTSTIDATIDEVHRALVWIGSHVVEMKLEAPLPASERLPG